MTDHHPSSHSSAGSSSSHSSSSASLTPAQPFVTDPNINFFGLTNFRNQYRKFGIKVDDRLRHVYVIGKSGMGKSTLLETMIVNDIYAGHGVGIIDPHGDLAENILRYMPEHRTKDVIYFNPGDLDFPVGFNILETVPPEVHGRISDGIRGLFKKIWPDVWSPRMENILNNVILALLEFPGASLMSINRMLADEEYFEQVVAKVQNPAVKLFWTKEYSTWNDKYKQEAIAPIQNKVGQFLSGSLIRNVVAQTKSTFNIRSIMDSGKIFIVNLAKGTIGEENSKLLGGMLVTTIYTSAMGRADIKDAKDRRPFFLYVDEFQNFATESFADILSEARKYGLSLTMAHQYMKQLDEKVLDAVIGNVGTMMSFRIGSGDSEILAKEFAPTFVEEDFLNLPKYQIYLKLLIDGVASSPFSAQTIPPAFQPTGFKEQAIKFSRNNYTVPRGSIEKQVLEWSGMVNVNPENIAHLGEIDDDSDGIPDFLQFKNKSKKSTSGGGTGASRREDRSGAGSNRGDRGNSGGMRGNQKNMNRGGAGGSDRPHRSDTRNTPRRDENQRPLRVPPVDSSAQKVLIGDAAAPGISLSSNLPKKENQSQHQATETPKKNEQRSVSPSHANDDRFVAGGGNKVALASHTDLQAQPHLKTDKPIAETVVQNTYAKPAYASMPPSHQNQKQATPSKTLPRIPPPLPPRPLQSAGAPVKPPQPPSMPLSSAGSGQSAPAHE